MKALFSLGVLAALPLLACVDGSGITDVDPNIDGGPDLHRSRSGVRVYEVTLENLTTGQPFSPGVIATHHRRRGVFEVGDPASEGIRLIAEDGNPGIAVDALSGRRGFHDVQATPAPVGCIGCGGPPFPTSLTMRVTAREGANRLSLAVMLICSNDGFTGLDGVRLPGGYRPRTYYAAAYDAGTEANDELFTSIVDPCNGIGPVAVAVPGDGANERTPTATNMWGEFEAEFDDDELEFSLDVFRNSNDIFAAHIHCAAPGVNGPIGVTLFNGSFTEASGTLASGTITAPNPGNSCGWADMAAVASAIESGNTYINVHTTAESGGVPSGEIRGNVSGDDDDEVEARLDGSQEVPPLNGVITHHAGTVGGGDLDPAAHGWTDPVLKVTVQRIRVRRPRELETEADLDGGQEVPAVMTAMTGEVKIEIEDGELDYELEVSDNTHDISAAHIHCAAPGVNGPVGVTLFSGSFTAASGTVAEGVIMAPDNGNGCGWVDLRDVAAAIRSGETYVNVHTTAASGGVPSGEIRGNLSGRDDDDE